MTAKEYIVEKINADAKEYLYKVRVFWRGPFGEFNERSGYFEDINEAMTFEEMLNKTYEKMKVPYLTSFRGSVVNNSHSYMLPELLDINVSPEYERKIIK